MKKRKTEKSKPKRPKKLKKLKLKKKTKRKKKKKIDTKNSGRTSERASNWELSRIPLTDLS
jgi:hypothetical protein